MSKYIEELNAQLKKTISTVTATVDDTISLAEASKQELENAIVIPQDILAEVDEKRSWFHQHRRTHPWEMIIGSAFTAGVLSAPLGRLPMIRNAAVIGIIATSLVAPEKLVSTFHKRKEYYP